MACVLAALMVVGAVPVDFAGLGAKEVKAAGNTTITGWTNKNNTDGIEVTENGNSIVLDCSNKQTMLGKGDLSNTALLTIGEATTKDITISCDITVSSVNATNYSGIGIGLLKDYDLANASYTYVAYRGGGNIRAAYQKNDASYGSTKVDTLDTASPNTKYSFELIKNSTGNSITCNVKSDGTTYTKAIGGGNLGYSLSTDALLPCIFIDSTVATLENLKVTVDGQDVYPLASGQAVSADIKYNSDTIATVSARYSTETSTLSAINASESKIVFSEEPQSGNLTIEASSANQYGGTSSFTVSLDTDNKNVVVKNGETTLVSIPYVVDGYLNALSIGGSETYDFATEKKVFGDASVTIANKTSPNGYILLSKNSNTELNVNNNTHGLYFGEGSNNITFSVKVPAASMGKFSITGCMYNSGKVTANYYLSDDDKTEEVISTGKTDADPSKDISYVNTTNSEVTLKIDIDVTGGTYIHSVKYEVSDVPNTVSGSVGAAFAGNKLTFTSSSDTKEATIDANGKYSVQLKRGLTYSVSIDSTTYELSDTVDLTGAGVGEALTKDFTPELIPQVVTHPEKASATPSVTNMTKGELTVKELGQTLVLTQKASSGSSATPTTTIADSTVSFYAFPATADCNTLEADLVLSYKSGANTNNFVAFGLINQISSNYGTLTSAVRSNSDVVMLYSKKASELMGKSSNTAISASAEEKLHFKMVKESDGITLSVTNTEGKNNPKKMAYSSLYASDASDDIMYGFILNGVTATVTNMVYKNANGNTIYDQNTYYDPMGSAPVVNSVTAVAASDRTKIDVSWTGEEAKYDGKYVLEVLKPGATEWVEVESELTDTSYSYPVSPTEGGNYKFRVCGTLGNSRTLNEANRNTWAVSEEVYIEPALNIPVVTLGYISSGNKVDLSWTASSGATSYEVYRRSSDESEPKKIATVTGTLYSDTTVTAEVPYYYSIKALSSDNFSPLSEEAWTLPTNGHSGNYDENVPLYVTKRSYNTVFKDKITIEGVAGAPGTVSVYVNGTKQQSANIAKVYDTFAFDENITLSKGRNEVKLVLEYNNGLQVVKTLNYVYLSGFDYVVDDDFSGTAGDTSKYGVPQYKTVTEAVNAIGADNASTKVIFVRNGEYNEKMEVNSPNISIIGEDSEKTRVYYDVADNRGASGSVRYAFTVNKTAKNFTAENVTIENAYPYKGDGTISNESAEAFFSEADGTMLIGVRLLGYQDTLQIKNGNFYLQRSYVLGNVDFMWGQNCKVIFDDCDLVFRYSASKNSGYYTAFNTDPSATYGVIYNDCRFTSESSCGGTKYLLGRPYNNVSATAFVNCYMGSVINKDWGYSDWSGKELSTNEEVYANTRYFECGSYGPGFAVNVNRRQISQAGADALMSGDKAAWESKASTLGNLYIGDKNVTPETGFVESSFNSSDKYSAYESNDTGFAKYNAEGFASTKGVTGGGLLKETNSNYYKVSTANEFLDALAKVKNSKGVPSVIEITADLNLGYNEVANASSYPTNVLAKHNDALISTKLKKSGVSKVYIQDISNLTIFSSNASSIKHAALDIKQSSNVIIRNIKFDELWEWDENDKGGYDTNDWDYMTIENASNGIWIDHCTFFKSYDGVVDMKTDMVHDSPMNITVSWCQFLPGSESDTFFNEVMSQLESNPSAYPYYKSLLDSGMSAKQIRDYAYGQKKTHLLGQDDKISTNTNLHVTFANNYYYDSMDRMPRVRYGTAHMYNCVMDAQELFDARMSITNKDAAKHIVSNGASSTCDANVLLENCYLNGIINALNSGNGSSPSGYINAINSLYYINGTRYKLEPKVNNSLEASDRTLKVTDASSFKSSLGYSYVLRDAATLSSTVVPYTGAGSVNMSVLQWEKSSYIDTVEAGSDVTYTNDGLPTSNFTDELGNESSPSNPDTGDSDDSDDDYSGSDDSSDTDSSDTSSTEVNDILKPEEIPGATVTQIDGTNFAELEEISEGAEKVIAAINAEGQITTDAPVIESTADVTSTVVNKLYNDASNIVTTFAKENTSITKEVFDKLKETGKTLSIGVVDKDGKVNSIVTIDGSQLTGKSVNFNLKITVDAKDNKVERVADRAGIKDSSYTIVDFEYSGNLPGTLKAAVNVSKKFTDGTRVALYYYNSKKGVLENQYQIATVSNGFAEFAIDHCSEYVLVDVTAAEGTITTSTLGSPKTADSNAIIFWLMLMCVAVLAFFGIQASKTNDKKKA